MRGCPVVPFAQPRRFLSASRRKSLAVRPRPTRNPCVSAVSHSNSSSLRTTFVSRRVQLSVCRKGLLHFACQFPFHVGLIPAYTVGCVSAGRRKTLPSLDSGPVNKDHQISELWVCSPAQTPCRLATSVSKFHPFSTFQDGEKYSFKSLATHCLRKKKNTQTGLAHELPIGCTTRKLPIFIPGREGRSCCVDSPWWRHAPRF